MQKSYKLFCSQVSGKQPKLLTADQRTILKGYCTNEFNFYQYMNSLNILDPAYKLKQFIPKFEGIVNLDSIPTIQNNDKVKDERTLEWLQHLKKRYQIRNPQNKFILLQNLILKYRKPNVLDIKLGTRARKELKAQKQPSKYFFILNGSRINVKNSKQTQNQEFQTLFFSKYFYKDLKSDDQILEHLAFYFYDGEKLKQKLLNQVIQKLRQIILTFKSLSGWKLFSTSLCIFTDAYDENSFDVKLIDFGRSFHTQNNETQQSVIIGLENLHRFLMKICLIKLQIQIVLSSMKQKYLKQAILIIPDRKVKQYQHFSRENSEASSPKMVFQQV